MSLETGMNFQTITKASYVTDCCYSHHSCVISKHLKGHLLCLAADKNKPSSLSCWCLTNWKKQTNKNNTTTTTQQQKKNQSTPIHSSYLADPHYWLKRPLHKELVRERDIFRSARSQWTDRYPKSQSEEAWDRRKCGRHLMSWDIKHLIRKFWFIFPSQLVFLREIRGSFRRMGVCWSFPCQ